MGELPKDSDPLWKIKDKTGKLVEAEYLGGGTTHQNISTVFLILEPTTKPEELQSLYFDWNGVAIDFDIDLAGAQN